MSLISAFNAAFRDFNVDGVPASGRFSPIKSAIRALGSTICSTASGFYGGVSAQWYGAVGDGTTDDSAAVQNALNAGASAVYLPPGSYKLHNVTIPANTMLYGLGGAVSKIIPGLSGAGGDILILGGSNITVQDIGLVGTGVTANQGSNNTYGIVRHASTSIDNIKIRRCNFLDMPFGGSPGDPTNLFVCHTIYIDTATNVLVEQCSFNNVSGAAKFFRNVTNLSVLRNVIVNARWYNIHLESGNTLFEIAGNFISHTFAPGVYWGGMIDMMSQLGNTRNSRGSVHDNFMTGLCSYGAVVRISSIDDVNVYSNHAYDVAQGSISGGNTLTHYRVVTRGIGTGTSQNGPCNRITIRDNHGTSAEAAQILVYITNEWQTAYTPARTIKVIGNTCRSVDSTHNFAHLVQVGGQDGGIDDLTIDDNSGEIWTTGTATITGGAIGLNANSAQGLVSRLRIGRNNLRNLNAPVNTSDLAIQIGGFVDKVVSEVNFIDNFWNGMRTLTNAGPTLRYLDEQSITTSGSNALLFTVEPSNARQTNVHGATAARPASGVGRITGLGYGDDTLNERITFLNGSWRNGGTGAAV